ncbi:zinc transport system ATP-binding protein [Sinobacterium caligoides]|uniref:Zinc transport system ATP-binding protein n=1 Tax=Sinobacterium caligoides TaxID=933926 RepID=A0A3N2DGQ9_9GAMM|nr:zinc ABC transporter ATP-binding protein ZnuC [Sinobacterium caligoides]ROR98970.1 zinc transport system ATP-binding protein [Sinobacterium caligoides]
MTRLLEARQLGFRANEQQILSDVELSINRSEITTIIGPNGAGKSTLLRLLLNLSQPTSGSVWRKPGLVVGYMPQKLQINPHLPITVERFLKLAGASRQAIGAALERTGASKVMQSPLQNISGGELQRVLLARALLRQPQLLVLDEPVQGVDVTGQIELYQLIKTLRDELDCGVIMVSHDLHLVMAATDTVICLNQHICCHGHPESVSSHPAYLELFGRKHSEDLALYTHHHDHCHDSHGDIIDDDHSECNHD